MSRLTPVEGGHMRERAVDREAVLRELGDNVDLVLWMAEAEESGQPSQLIYISTAVEQILGLRREDLYESPRLWWRLVHPDDQEAARNLRSQASRGHSSEGQYRIVRDDGATRWIREKVFGVPDAGGRIKRLAGVAEDITERLAAESERERVREALRLSEERSLERRQILEALFRSSPVGIATYDLSGSTTAWNEAMERIFGWSQDEVLGGPAPHLPRHDPRFRDIQRRALSGESLTDIETVRYNRDGVGVHCSISTAPLYGASGELVGAIALTMDISNRKQAEEELLSSYRERQYLLTRVVHAQEDERRRIAADIHDDPIQALTVAKMQLDLLRQEQVDAQAFARELDATLTNVISRLRHLLFELHPPALEDTGLESALDEYLERFRGETGTHFSLSCVLQSTLSQDILVTVYRIFQEALVNVRRHARASSVDVAVDELDEGIRVRIRDDGAGFEVQRRGFRRRPGHLGLTAMRERAEMSGGWCRISSEPGDGTVVEYWLPLQARAGRVSGPET